MNDFLMIMLCYLCNTYRKLYLQSTYQADSELVFRMVQRKYLIEVKERKMQSPVDEQSLIDAKLREEQRRLDAEALAKRDQR